MLVDSCPAAARAALDVDTGATLVVMADAASAAAASIRAAYASPHASLPAATLSRLVAPTGEADWGRVEAVGKDGAAGVTAAHAAAAAAPAVTAAAATRRGGTAGRW